MRGRSALLAAFAVILGAACAPIPPPSVLADADRAGASPAAREAKEYAPQAFAHAEKLRREADVAFAAHDHAGAQLLGERAIAAYGHADALARIARAEAIGVKARAEAAASQTELAAIATDQTRVGAEVDALELRVKVAREAQSIVPSGAADPAREKARLAAARALGLQARLLCSAAHMLLADRTPAAAATSPAPPAPAAGAPLPSAAAADAAVSAAPPEAAQLALAEGALTKLDAALGPPPPAVVPIDMATRARAGCLAVLTSVRRAGAPVAKAPGAGDALLAELSAVGALAPSRDDRGVVVTLRGFFAGNGYTAAGQVRLGDLGRVAAAHPAFPVEVIVHQDKDSPKELEASRARADAAVTLLKTAGARHVESTLAGSVSPVVDPAGGDRGRNARVEIVFVTPESL